MAECETGLAGGLKGAKSASYLVWLRKGLAERLAEFTETDGPA